ncbi:MAG: ROK family protein, partial [Defluviitaleaceae bacterium]|nr:ROK family protein [Defluviitaleaceae bacterium]
GTSLTAQEIAALNTTESKAAFYDAGFYVGKAVAQTVTMLNIDTVVFGGGVSESFELLLPGIKDALDKNVFKQANGNVNLLKTALGYNAGLLGAAAVGFANV